MGERTPNRHGVMLSPREPTLRWCVTWLHDRAASMNDPRAQQVLNDAAAALGVVQGRYRAASDECKAGVLREALSRPTDTGETP